MTTDGLLEQIVFLLEEHGVNELILREDLRHLLDSLSDIKRNDQCPYCGASLKEYWHKLTPMLVNGLVKMKQKILNKNENRIHLQDDLSLSKTEYNNFQKLRFHGLIAHCKNEDGSRDSGYWLITKRGNDFLYGKIKVPARVKTFRNKVIDHDEKLVSIDEIIHMIPFSEQEFQYTLHNLQES
jgi:hypothetical protein